MCVVCIDCTASVILMTVDFMCDVNCSVFCQLRALSRAIVCFVLILLLFILWRYFISAVGFGLAFGDVGNVEACACLPACASVILEECRAIPIQIWSPMIYQYHFLNVSYA